MEKQSAMCIVCSEIIEVANMEEVALKSKMPGSKHKKHWPHFVAEKTLMMNAFLKSSDSGIVKTVTGSICTTKVGPTFMHREVALLFDQSLNKIILSSWTFISDFGMKLQTL